MQDNINEMLPIVNEDGKQIGQATRGECHGGSMLLHPVVHLHLFDKEGRLYLQRRPEWKDIQPGKWDTAVGGHVDLGETVDIALIREAREELDIVDFTPTFIKRYLFQSSKERELVNVFTTVVQSPPRPTQELDGGRFWSIIEIRDAIGKNLLTPNFEQEFLTVLSPLLAPSDNPER